MTRNPSFLSFASFSIVSLTPFTNKPDSSGDLTLFMISSISSFENINVVPNPKTFFWIAASIANADAVSPNGAKTFLANYVSMFFVNGTAILINGARNLSNPPSWLLILLVVHFNKIPLFSKVIITLLIYFVSFFVSTIPQPLISLIAKTLSKAEIKVPSFSF